MAEDTACTPLAWIILGRLEGFRRMPSYRLGATEAYQAIVRAADSGALRETRLNGATGF